MKPDRTDIGIVAIPGQAQNEMAKKIRPILAEAMAMPKQKRSDSPLQPRLAEIQQPRPRA